MRRLFILPLVLLVWGCSTLDIPKPQNLGEQLVAAEVAATGAIKTAAEVKKAGLIEPGSLLDQRVTAVIHAIDGALDQAQEAYLDDQEVSAREWLEVAIGTTQGLKEILDTLGGEK